MTQVQYVQIDGAQVAVTGEKELFKCERFLLDLDVVLGGRTGGIGVEVFVHTCEGEAQVKTQFATPSDVVIEEGHAEFEQYRVRVLRVVRMFLQSHEIAWRDDNPLIDVPTKWWLQLVEGTPCKNATAIYKAIVGWSDRQLDRRSLAHSIIEWPDRAKSPRTISFQGSDDLPPFMGMFSFIQGRLEDDEYMIFVRLGREFWGDVQFSWVTRHGSNFLKGSPLLDRLLGRTMDVTPTAQSATVSSERQEVPPPVIPMVQGVLRPDTGFAPEPTPAVATVPATAPATSTPGRQDDLEADVQPTSVDIKI